MGKTLVGRDNIEHYICQEERKICVDQTMILSPGAKDYLREKGISLVYGEQQPTAVKLTPKAEEASSANLNSTIQTILKRDYAITDHAQVVEVTKKVLAKLDAGQ